MTIEDDIAFLERVPMLRRLGDGALRSLAIGTETVAVDGGHVLFNAGDTADGAFLIRSGSFSLKPPWAVDAGIVAGPGTLLGESALLTETKRPATATARDPAIIVRVTRVMFLRVLESYPEAARRLREFMASRTDQWTREIENVRDALTRGVPQ